MTSSTSYSLAFVRTKSFLAPLLACAGLIAFASPPACATQTGVVSVLANFGGIDPADEAAGGLPPVTRPFKATDGNYYGISPIAGAYGNGFVFKVTPAGAYSVLFNFHDDEDSQPLVEQGDQPRVLIEGTDGNLYGVCNDGGLNDSEVNHDGGGTIFKLTFGGVYTKLYDFDTGDPNLAPVQPVALLQAGDGNFYGLTSLGGKADGANGVFFRFNASTKVFTELYDFNNTNTIGFNPEAQLFHSTDTFFYGTTTAGGGSDSSGEAYGTIFKINTAGQPTLLHVFQPDTDDPSVIVPKPDNTPLYQGTDGNLYGASTIGGSEDDDGTIYKCSTTGTFTLLHTFADNGDGANPYGGLVEGADGTFYGGLQGGFGTVTNPAGGYFQIRSGGAYTVLSKFNSANTTGPVLATSGLVEVTKGTFFGQTGGGTNDFGTLVKLIVSPVPTSAVTASATVGTAFSYQITATNTPTSFGVAGLPAGLSVNTTTGLISGTPTTAGTYSLTVNARNAGGVGSETVTLTVKAASGVPVITSAKSVSGTTGVAFSYQITATGSPTGYAVQGLPSGLTLNGSTGLISGTPTVAGTYSLSVHAVNKAGNGSATVTLTLTAPAGAPVITSAKSVSATTGVAFSYQITATGSPTGYAVQGLPSGLTLNGATGLISGTPTVAGTYSLAVHAVNKAGNGSATVTLTLTAPAGSPVITSAKTVTGTVGKAFSYQITATGSPTGYAVQGLPSGLTLNGSTGLISGTPKTAGTYSLAVHAVNKSGNGSATVTLTIAS